jgi:hypothetical protein
LAATHLNSDENKQQEHDSNSSLEDTPEQIKNRKIYKAKRIPVDDEKEKIPSKPKPKRGRPGKTRKS